MEMRAMFECVRGRKTVSVGGKSAAVAVAAG